MSERENKTFGKVYWHASPESNIQNFRASNSSVMRDKGLYVSPSYQSLIRDWAPHVLFSKSREDSYSSVTFYKLWIPDLVAQISEERMNKIKEEDFENNKEGFAHLFFWSWGQQLFIPQEFLSSVKIIGRETKTRKEVQQMAYKFSTPQKHPMTSFMEKNKNHPVLKILNDLNENISRLSLSGKIDKETKESSIKFVNKVLNAFVDPFMVKFRDEPSMTIEEVKDGAKNILNNKDWKEGALEQLNKKVENNGQFN